MFVLSCQVLTLVLEEDGTVVDSEDFFQTVPSSAALMVLDKGEMWTRSKVSIRLSHGYWSTDQSVVEPIILCCCFLDNMSA